MALLPQRSDPNPAAGDYGTNLLLPHPVDVIGGFPSFSHLEGRYLR